LSYNDGAAWAAGPDRVYRLLARAAIDLLADDLSGALFLDAGAGTGAASTVLRARGARTIAGDLSRAMVGFAPPPRFAGDVLHLPLRTASVDGAIANLVLSHVDDPGAALGELRRVTRAGGPVLATAFPSDSAHPVKDAADRVLSAFGYEPPGWYSAVKDLGEARAREALGAMAVRVEADIAALGVETLANWRLGMAQVAGFMSGLSPSSRERLVDSLRADVAALPEIPPLGLLVLVNR
jgi:ubiquinone/menaquinone biosynthesis C-methylase UbiE